MTAPGDRIRVVHVVPDLGVGGAERHVVTLMPRLDPSRFEATVICIGEPGALFDELSRTRVHTRALKRTKRQAVHGLLDLVEEFRRLRPDVVLVRGYNAEILGRLAALITRVPVSVVWVHNDGDIEPRGRLRKTLDALLDRSTTAYFGVAERQREYIVGELGRRPEKVTIIHNGVDPAAFTPEPDRSVARDLDLPESAPIVGIVAALRPEKDHELFLDAAALVRAARPDARFLIVGDGPMRERLEGLVEPAGLGSAVVFTGSRSDIPQVLRSLDVFVLCSYSIECFPMALLEAMAGGVPAVCTDVGGVGELLDDGVTGHLVPPHEPLALASAITSILDDPGGRAAMAAAARRRVTDHFTLDGAVARTQRQLTDLVSGQRPRRPLVLTVILDVTFVGGVELLLLDMFAHFDPAILRPRIVCLRDGGPLADRFRDAGVEITTITRSGARDPRRLTRLVADLRRSHTDVVMVTHHHRAALVLGRIAARICGIPNIIAAHDMDLTAVGGRVLPRSTVATLRASQALVLLSQSQGAYLRDEEGVGRSWLSRTPEVVIPNGITMSGAPVPAQRDAARRTLGLDADDFVIGMVARLSTQKAHEVALAAFAELLRTRPRSRLVIIGQGERENELRRLAEDFGVAHAVLFTGVRDDVSHLLPAFDVACLSSVHEGVPLAVIEYMAAGLPVVATDCGSLRDMVIPDVTGYLVDVGDWHTMALRFIDLCDDAGLRTGLGAAGRIHAEQHHQISDTARGYERLITTLARRKAPIA